MTGVLLMVLVPGTVMLALLIAGGAAIRWLRRWKL
jgi:hypothetical protein